LITGLPNEKSSSNKKPCSLQLVNVQKAAEAAAAVGRPSTGGCRRTSTRFDMRKKQQRLRFFFFSFSLNMINISATPGPTRAKQTHSSYKSPLAL
jgi:hypothetical protein